MADLQSLIQMAQAAQGGGASPAPAAGDPMMALKALLGQGGAIPPQDGSGSSMLQALTAAQGPSVGPPGTMGPGDQRDYPNREYPDRGPGNGPPGQQLMGQW